MQATIRKWGNSLGIRIPKIYSDKISIREGSQVEFEIEKDALIIRLHRRFDLNELVEAITSENVHKEFSFGNPEGKEIW